MGKVVVTRQDRVVVYQMEEREVEHTWYLHFVNAYINLSTHIKLFYSICFPKRYVDSAGGEVGAAVAARGR